MGRFKELIHEELIPHSLQWFNMEPFICGNIFLRLCHTFLLNKIIQICKNQGRYLQSNKKVYNNEIKIQIDGISVQSNEIKVQSCETNNTK